MQSKVSIRTPLIPFYGPTKKNIFLKLENLQPFGSYKIRGIENLIKNLTTNELKDGLVAASAGNMGQAVAYMAKKHNITCTILVPESAPLIKVKAIQSLGAKIIKLPYEKVWEVVQKGKYPECQGYFIHPANNLLMTNGYANIAKEILEDLPNLDAIVIPFGVGGLSLGVAGYLKKHNPKIKIYTVEPETASPLRRLLKENDHEFITVNMSIVDAIGTPEIVPSVRSVIKPLIDVTTVSTISQIKSAISILFNTHHIISEGAGAASLASALTNQVSGNNIACIISGGNIDFNKFMEFHR